MKRMPSLKTVLFCGFAALVVSMTIPINPHMKGASTAPTDAIPTIGSGNNTQTGNQTTNGSSAGNNPIANSTTPPPAPDIQNGTSNGTSIPPAPAKPLPESWGYTKAKTAKLRVHVIDGRTMKPLEGAEVVIIETEQRFKTDAKGYTPYFDAPVFRNPKYRPMVAELHGQLGAIIYKNGYRDSIHLGIRMHENIRQETTVWMYKIGPQDRRIEPVLYQEPYHHIWLIRLADKYRQKSQIGEGPERP